MHLMQKCIWCKNAFDAKMHLMLPLHFVYKMLESGKMHFGCAKMYFCITFSKGKCSATRTFSFGKCSAYILRSKMFSITFCFAEHFPKENVQHHIFQRKMFSIRETKNNCFLYFIKQNVHSLLIFLLHFYLLHFVMQNATNKNVTSKNKEAKTPDYVFIKKTTTIFLSFC